MGSCVLGFEEIDRTQVGIVGGRALTWGTFADRRHRTSAGFCVTTEGFQRAMAEAPSIDGRLDRLSRMKPDDKEAIRGLSAEIRLTVEGIAIGTLPGVRPRRLR